MPFLEDTPLVIDCIFCDNKQYPDTNDILSETLLGFVNEVRSGQITMADEITNSLETKIPTLFEAGTGVGKSFAYLLPAVLSRKRTIVSTAKIALQNQLVEKDLPRIQEYLKSINHPRADFTYAAAYGKNKYACYAECHKEKSGTKQWPNYLKLFTHSDTGLWDDAHKLHLKLDESLNATDCIGPDCGHYKNCGYVKSRKTMLNADIVITNNWLLGFHYKLRHTMPHFHLLGEFAHVIVDEAHKIEDGIRSAFTNETSLNALDKLQYRFDKLLDVSHKQFELPELALLAPDWKAAFNALDQLYLHRTSIIDTNTGNTLKVLLGGLQAVTDALLRKDTLDEIFLQLSPITHTELINRWVNKTISATVAVNPIPGPVGMPARSGFPFLAEDQSAFLALEKMLGLIEDSSETFKSILDAPPNRTWIIESTMFKGKQNLVLKDMPVNIGNYLPDKAVTYVSATLVIDNKFDTFAGRVGLYNKPHQSDVFASPFNLQKQANLYIPKQDTIPVPVVSGPGVADYLEKSASQIYELLLASEGDAFVLFTANAEIKYTKDYLVNRGYPYPVFDQLTYTATDALARFRATPKATVLGSKSFWEGVDVPGKKLFMVIIPKLPFPNPSDAIVVARKKAIDGNSFNFVDYADMMFDLRQGIGRLIRTQKDRGILAILDTRLTFKPYRHRVLNAVGVAPLTDLTEVCRRIRTRHAG